MSRGREAGAGRDDLETEEVTGPGPLKLEAEAEAEPESAADDGQEGGQAEGSPDDPLAQVTIERDDYLDALRRLQADFENYRKRMAKQQGEHSERATEALVTRLLPVLDTVDMALAHAVAGGAAHGEAAALAQVSGALSEALGREGLERIDPCGQAFDPTEHDAVLHEPRDGEESSGPEVSEVLRAGYRWKGRVLRPAMVKVQG